MSLTISVTYDDSLGFYTPGFNVVVTGLSGISGADHVQVQRVDLGTGSMDDVRGLSDAPVLSDTAIATDFEYPYYNDVIGWQYVCFVFDISGTQLATVTSGTQTGIQTVADLTSQFPCTSVVLASITQPAISIPVIIGDFPAWSIPPNVLSALKPLGRAKKVVLTDTFGGREGSFTILSLEELTSIDDSYVARLLTYNDTFLFQPYYTSGNIGNMYFKVTGVDVERLTYAESLPSFGRQTVSILQYTVGFIEVDRPIANSVGVALISWQDVLNNNASWQTVHDDHTNWLDVLNNPTG